MAAIGLATSGSSTTGPTTTYPISAEATRLAAPYAGKVPTQWGLAVSGVLTRFRTTAKEIALTFDACGGPAGSGIDTELIDLLRQEGVKATLFLNGRWMERNPGYTRQLAQEHYLFELENHGTRHRPLSVTGQSAYGIKATTSAAEVVDEVLVNHQTLTRLLGRPPKFFRPGTAFCDEVAVSIVQERLAERVVGFTVNADAGATASRKAIIDTVTAVKPGNITIGHFNRPKGSTFEGFSEALRTLKADGFTFVKLEEVADRLR